MDKNNQNKGQSLDRVGSRIELLEKQLMEKDQELKKLLNASKNKDEEIAELKDSTVEESDNTFVPVFDAFAKSDGVSRNERTSNNDMHDADMSESLKQQLDQIEKREQLVKEMLEVLEEAFGVLKERNDTLNRKEETLNREYLKLLEIESMYQGTDRLADSLSAVLPSFNLEEKREAAKQTNEGQNGE